MKLEKGKISGSQLTFLVACLIVGSLQTTGFAVQIVENNTWLAVLTGLGVSTIFVLVYIRLALLFPGTTLIQILTSLYGPYFGKFLSLLYLLYFMLVIFSNFRFVSDFITTYLLPETPAVIIAILFMLICAQAVYYGIEVIARTSFLFLIMSLVVVILTSLLLFDQMDFRNLLPILDIRLIDLVHSAHVMASIPFCEVLVFLMIIPYTNNLNKVKPGLLGGLLIGGSVLILAGIRNTAVLGNLESILTSASFQAVRLIDIATVFTRLEILVAVVMLVAMFLKTSIFFYASALGFAQLFDLRSYYPLVLPLGIISVCFALSIYDFNLEMAMVGAQTWPTFTVPFLYVFPVVSLLLALFRKRKSETKGN